MKRSDFRPTEKNIPFRKSNIGWKSNKHMIIIVPSTYGKKHISSEETEKRARNVASKMTEEFGGSTRIAGKGQYVRKDNGKIDDEDVIEVEVFMEDEKWKKNKPKITRYLYNKRKEWKQESLGVEYDDAEKLYYLKTNKKKRKR